MDVQTLNIAKSYADTPFAPGELQSHIMRRAFKNSTLLTDFEAAGTTVEGTITYDTDIVWSGEKSVKIVTSEAASYGGVRYDFGASPGLDLSNSHISLMVYRPSSSAGFDNVRLQLWGDGFTNLGTWDRTYGGPVRLLKDRWELLVFGPGGTGVVTDPVRYIELWVQKVGAPVTMYADHMRLIPNSLSNGMVTITFDGNYIGQYTQIRPLLDAKGYRGVLMSIKDRLGVSGAYMTQAQVEHLRDLGWDIATHSGDAPALNLRSESELLTLARDRYLWVRRNGFQGGGRFICGLQDDWNETAVRVLSRYFWLLRVGAGPKENAGLNSFPAFNVRNIRSVASNVDYSTQSTAITRAATHKQWAVLTWHEPNRPGELSLSEMEDILDDIEAAGLDVVTFSDVVDGVLNGTL